MDRASSMNWSLVPQSQLARFEDSFIAVQRFIEAASHMHDLRQALRALESAEPTENTTVAAHLRVYAAVASGRTYGSNARPDLATFTEMSSENIALTARLKAIRSKYAAPSKNSMAVTLPVLDLQKELDATITIQRLSAITVDTPMPQPFVIEFAAMLGRLIERFTSTLQPMKHDVRAELAPPQVAAAFDDRLAGLELKCRDGPAACRTYLQRHIKAVLGPPARIAVGRSHWAPVYRGFVTVAAIPPLTPEPIRHPHSQVSALASSRRT